MDTWRTLLMSDVNEALFKRTPLPKTHNVDEAIEVAIVALCAAYCGSHGIDTGMVGTMSASAMKIIKEIGSIHAER